MQALLKSAWLVRQARGVRHGLDWRSAREPLASLFYNVRHKVEFWQPAVIRQRKLAATFGYQYAGQPDFGLQSFARQGGPGSAGDTVHDVPSEGLNVSDVPKLHHLDLDRGYAVVMPSASRDDKLWPEDDWRVVFRRLRDAGCALKLLAGNEQEAERARLLVAGMDGAEVLPRMSLTDVARLLAGSRLMVGLDSGLTRPPRWAAHDRHLSGLDPGPHAAGRLELHRQPWRSRRFALARGGHGLGRAGAGRQMT